MAFGREPVLKDSVPQTGVGSLHIRVQASADKCGDDELDESPHEADDDQPRREESEGAEADRTAEVVERPDRQTRDRGCFGSRTEPWRLRAPTARFVRLFRTSWTDK